MAEAATDKLSWRRRCKYGLEAIGAGLMFGLFRILPLPAASALGGSLARRIGPHLSVANRARRNLARFMPELGKDQAEKIVAGMFDNLGRVVAEWPHMNDFRLAERAERPGDIEVVGAEYLEGHGNGNGAILLFGAHLGNWELKSTTCKLLGIPAYGVYRAANNPYVDTMMARFRAQSAAGTVAKGAQGAKSLIGFIRGGHAVGMVVDQKMNDGIAVPFFGIDAMTAPALAQLALRYDVPVLGVRSERLDGARFRITFTPPLTRPDSGDRQADVLAMMTEVNKILEGWIRARPEQWMWLHRRWPD
jgi:KDO2-lipid IV(A) lauroyltransferase